MNFMKTVKVAKRARPKAAIALKRARARAAVARASGARPKAATALKRARQRARAAVARALLIQAVRQRVALAVVIQRSKQMIYMFHLLALVKYIHRQNMLRQNRQAQKRNLVNMVT